MAPPGHAADWVPPGFESLLEKQRTVIDIYYGGVFLTSTMATYNSNEISFESPDAIVSAMDNLLDAQTIRDGLHGILPTHAELRCYSVTQPGCGDLLPETVGVIFNEDTFRADIFVNPALLSENTLPVQAWLPPSDTEWSFLQNFSGAFSGTDDEISDNYSFNAASTLSYAENRLVMLANYSNDTDWTADELLLRRDFRGLEYQFGYFQTFNDSSLRFIPQSTLRGVRFASTVDTRTDLDLSTGRELSVFLSSRSRVSLFKDDRLVSSRNYDAGNQILDTSRLPPGAYPITIRIDEVSGRVREEQRFYVKNSRFPPRDQTLFGVELGEQTTRQTRDFLPESTQDLVARVSFSRRALDNLAINGGLATTEDDLALELGLDFLTPTFDFQLNGATSNNGGYGASFTGNTQWNRVTLTLGYRETGADDGQETHEEDLYLGENPPPAYSTRPSWFLDDSRQFDASAGFYLGQGTVNLLARHNRIGAQEAIDEFSARYTYPLWQSGRYDLRLDTEATWSNEDVQGLISLNFRWDSLPFSHTAEYTGGYRKPDNGDADTFHEGGISSAWHKVTENGSDLNFLARANSRRAANSTSLEGRYRGHLGRGGLQLEYVDPDEADSFTSINGSAATSFAVSSGNTAVGGAEQSRSGLIVQLDGPDSDAWFDVLVNGTRRGSARMGQNSIITLEPFETYRVEIQPRGEVFTHYESRPRSVTLYPGNIATLNWDVAPVIILFGQLLDESGEAVRNAVLRGASGLAMTDDTGFFQAEVTEGTEKLTAETRERHCHFGLPDYEVINGIALLGTLRCDSQSK